MTEARPGFVRFDGLRKDKNQIMRAWFEVVMDDAEEGDTIPIQVPVTTGKAENGKWKWDGNVDAPTLSPSLLMSGIDGATVHFFLRGGVIQPCGDQTLRVDK